MTARPAKLSKSILEMKFMKRTKEKVLREEDDAKGRAMYSNEITEKMLSGDCLYIMEPSYVPCEDLNDGRFSFRGMNPEIERLVQQEEAARKATIDQDVTKDVSDKDMSTTCYSSVMKTIEKKFQSKNRRRKLVLSEPQFKKPKTDD